MSVVACVGFLSKLRGEREVYVVVKSVGGEREVYTVVQSVGEGRERCTQLYSR